jgi:syntaxin-binding protein 5
LHLDAASDEKQTQLSEDKIPSQDQAGKEGNRIETQGVEKHLKNASQLSHNGGSDSLVVCCEDVLFLLSLASLIQVCTWLLFLNMQESCLPSH